MEEKEGENRRRVRKNRYRIKDPQKESGIDQKLERSGRERFFQS